MTEIKRGWHYNWKWFDKPREAVDKWGHKLEVLGTTPPIRDHPPTDVGKGFFYQRDCDPEGHLGSSSGHTIVFQAEKHQRKHKRNLSQMAHATEKERNRKIRQLRSKKPPGYFK